MNNIQDSKVELKNHRDKSGESTKVLVFCFLRGNHSNNLFLQVKEMYFSDANSTRSTQANKDR